MHRLLVALGAIATLAAAGCTTDPTVESYSISGTFSESATEAQMQELGGYVRERGGDLLLMESFPVQFRATGLDVRECGEVRTFAGIQAYVAELGVCQPAS